MLLNEGYFTILVLLLMLLMLIVLFFINFLYLFLRLIWSNLSFSYFFGRVVSLYLLFLFVFFTKDTILYMTHFILFPIFISLMCFLKQALFYFLPYNYDLLRFLIVCFGLDSPLLITTYYAIYIFLTYLSHSVCYLLLYFLCATFSAMPILWFAFDIAILMLFILLFGLELPNLWLHFIKDFQFGLCLYFPIFNALQFQNQCIFFSLLTLIIFNLLTFWITLLHFWKLPLIKM